VTEHDGGDLARYWLNIGNAIHESEMGCCGVSTPHDISCQRNTLLLQTRIMHHFTAFSTWLHNSHCYINSRRGVYQA
jgi:hypothetical protein